MGIFDFLKKKKQSPKKEKKQPKLNLEQKSKSTDNGIYDLAYASTKYKEAQKNYSVYKKELLTFGFDDSKIVRNTIGIILKLYYASEKDEALNLYEKINNDYPKNEDITWLFIEVINTINIENDQEFVKKYLKEAIGLWTSLNKIKEFSWNYYQIGILQNAMGNENCLRNLRKGIEMDDEIKEDAKSYSELDNLRKNQEFLKMIE